MALALVDESEWCEFGGSGFRSIVRPDNLREFICSFSFFFIEHAFLDGREDEAVCSFDSPI